MKRNKPIKRKTPLARSTKPIRKVSKKRARDNVTYTRLRKEFLASHPYCEFTLAYSMGGKINLSTDIHHKKGRLGGNFLDTSTWAAVCREAHDYIHAHPAWARKNGWILT